MCCTLCLISAYFSCDSFSLSPYFPSVLSDAYVSSGQHIPYSAGFATHTANHHQSVTQHVWSDHTLPVTDVYCGVGGVRARVATVSLDQTCKVRAGMDKLTIMLELHGVSNPSIHTLLEPLMPSPPSMRIEGLGTRLSLTLSTVRVHSYPVLNFP